MYQTTRRHIPEDRRPILHSHESGRLGVYCHNQSISPHRQMISGAPILVWRERMLTCCWSSPAQWSLIPRPIGPTTISWQFGSLQTLGIQSCYLTDSYAKQGVRASCPTDSQVVTRTCVISWKQGARAIRLIKLTKPLTYETAYVSD
jgi:hypothetical protein